jgi:hypothetical protein
VTTRNKWHDLGLEGIIAWSNMMMRMGRKEIRR